MKTTDFSNIETDLAPIGLIRDQNFSIYFCTPENAVVFANIGCDGIHFCVIPEENDLTLDHSPVYVVSPMMPDHYVEAVADTFDDFISLVVSVKDAGALECISHVEPEVFMNHISDIPQGSSEVESAVAALSRAFPVRIIDDIYGYVRQTQAKTDLAKIRFSEEYYDLT